MDAKSLADALLHREPTAKRLLKLRRHLSDDPWKRPGYIDPAKVTALLDAIEQHPHGGELTRAMVHEAIVNAPTRTLPPLPEDIAEKLEAFKAKQAAR